MRLRVEQETHALCFLVKQETFICLCVCLLLIDDHSVSEATLSWFSVGVDIIVTPDSLVTVLFKI